MKEPQNNIPIIEYIIISLFLLLSIYALIDYIKLAREKKVDNLVEEMEQRLRLDEPIKYDNLNDQECQSERNYIIKQTKHIDNVVISLEESYKKLSKQEFEKYLTKWNKDIELIRNGIDNYNYQCFKYSGIKGLGTLASQVGLDYIDVVMYNDNSDLLKTKQRFKEKKGEILKSLNANN